MARQRQWIIAIKRLEEALVLMDELADTGSWQASGVVVSIQAARDHAVLTFRRHVRPRLRHDEARSFAGLAEGNRMFRDMLRTRSASGTIG